MENHQDRPGQLTGQILIVKKKILIIDDNAEQLYLLETLLALGDYVTVTAVSGEKALQLLTAFDLPDLILLDIKMPDMSGTEFLLMLEKKIPAVFETVPVVFLTAMKNVPLSKAVGFISKPFIFDKFLETVNCFIVTGGDRRRLHYESLE